MKELNNSGATPSVTKKINDELGLANEKYCSVVLDQFKQFLKIFVLLTIN